MANIYLAVAIILEVVSTSLLKVASDRDQWWYLVPVILGYACAFPFLILALKSMSIGVVYAIWAGGGIALVALLGVFWFGERFDLAGVIGISLIIIGVLVLNAFSGMAHR
ncbi:MAG: DMT family transporter [Geminicoccaceae bacterium]